MDKSLLERIVKKNGELDVAKVTAMDAAALWQEFLKSLKGKSEREVQMELSNVYGAPVDIDKPIDENILDICEFKKVSKNRRDFFFKITAPRIKQTYAIDGNGQLQTVKIGKETVHSLSVVPLTTPWEYQPIVDTFSAEGYNALETINADVLSSMNLAEIEKVFAVIDAAVPVANQFTLTSGTTKFTYLNLKAMRAKIKNYASKFVLYTGFQIDEDILAWDYDENKYRSIFDMARDLNVEIKYVGQWTLKKDGVDTVVIDSDVAYMVGYIPRVNGKPVLFARKELGEFPLTNVTFDESRQRFIQFNNGIRLFGSTPTAVYDYWGYEEMQCVVVCPPALCKFTRT